MSDLTTQQLGALERKLADELARIVDETRTAMNPGLKANYVDVDGNVADPGDDSVADVLIDTDNALIGQHLQQIRELKAALGRVRKGEYGACIHCGADIGYERLCAYPAAQRCIACQSVHEKTYAGEPKPTL